jgi:hypothetical protein
VFISICSSFYLSCEVLVVVLTLSRHVITVVVLFIRVEVKGISPPWVWSFVVLETRPMVTSCVGFGVSAG